MLKVLHGTINAIKTFILKSVEGMRLVEGSVPAFVALKNQGKSHAAIKRTNVLLVKYYVNYCRESIEVIKDTVLFIF